MEKSRVNDGGDNGGVAELCVEGGRGGGRYI